MKEQSQYEQELREICEKIRKSFSIKFGMASAMSTNKYIKRVIKLNKETQNKNINELIYLLGRTKLEYKKYCNKHRYYPDPYVNKKIKEAYIKLSNKAMKLEEREAKRNKNIKNTQIEYNSNRGSYMFNTIENGTVVNSKEYKINDIKHLGAKRAMVLKRLRHMNFGVNIFDELEIDERNFYKINPDIVNIFLNEGQISNAKMYIKEVVGGETIHKPFEIRYVLNRNLNKGVFSPEENKNMKQMAKTDRLANELIIFSEKRKKMINKTKENTLLKIIAKIKKFVSTKLVTVKEKEQERPRIVRYVNNNPIIESKYAQGLAQEARIKNIRRSIYNGKNIVPNHIQANSGIKQNIENTGVLVNRSGKAVAYGNVQNRDVQKHQTIGRYINTNTGKIAALGER
ncbi:MAG: hypothetical protein IKQ33_02325 [Clostridia bacterium]|nr:hypothetical protein [Clostridia bacterium]